MATTVTADSQVSSDTSTWSNNNTNKNDDEDNLLVVWILIGIIILVLLILIGYMAKKIFCPGSKQQKKKDKQQPPTKQMSPSTLESLNTTAKSNKQSSISETSKINVQLKEPSENESNKTGKTMDKLVSNELTATKVIGGQSIQTKPASPTSSGRHQKTSNISPKENQVFKDNNRGQSKQTGRSTSGKAQPPKTLVTLGQNFNIDLLEQKSQDSEAEDKVDINF